MILLTKGHKMKRILSLIVALILTACCFPVSASAAEESPDYMEYITEIKETVIEIDGISTSKSFFHIADSHVVNLSTDTNSYYYSDSVERYNHFINIGNGKPAKDIFKAMFQYAADENNGIDCVWMTGDNIDFPSNENISYLSSVMSSNPVDYLYTPGNHDWTYPSHYFDAYARSNYRPLLNPFMNDNLLIGVRNYGDFMVVRIDNSENYIYYDSIWTQLNQAVISTGLPVILICHVPPVNTDLQNFCYGVWGTDETMNPKSAKYPNNNATTNIYNWITTSGQVKAVFSGHLHTNYEGVLPGGVPIYVTNGAFTGTARKITVKPTSCETHTWDDGQVITAPTTHKGESFFTCTVCGETKTEETPAIYLFGDLNGDGKHTSIDMLNLRRIISRSVGFENEGQRYSADVNDDGKVNAKDSLYLRKYMMGIIDLPA